MSLSMTGRGGVNRRQGVSFTLADATHADGNRHFASTSGAKASHIRSETDMNLLARLVREEEGQDIIEYALLGAFISIIAIVAIRAVGQDVNRIFTLIDTELGA